MNGRGVRLDWLVPRAPAAVLVSFLALPILALGLSTPPSDFLAGLSHPLVWPALRLSLMTTATSLGVVVAFGTPLAWLLSRNKTRLTHLLEGLLQLPVVIPPAVAGVAMLLAFGRRGLLGGWLEQAGMQLAFTTPAVVLAEVFVSAPFYVQGARAAFAAVDPNLLTVARSLGASPVRAFFAVALPLAWPGLLGGAAMSWARALGEFGATLLFAGNLTGRTQTLPLAIYTALETDLRAAQALSLVLVIAAFLLLTLLRLAERLLRERTHA